MDKDKHAEWLGIIRCPWRMAQKNAKAFGENKIPKFQTATRILLQFMLPLDEVHLD